MGRLSVSDLSPPSRRYDPALQSANSKPRFWSAQQNRDEDANRVPMIRKAAHLGGDLYEAASALDLADRLDYARSGAQGPQTMASKLYAAKYDRMVSAALWKLI